MRDCQSADCSAVSITESVTIISARDASASEKVYFWPPVPNLVFQIKKDFPSNVFPLDSEEGAIF